MSDVTPSPTDKKPKGRSPSYPAIDLDEAVRRARQLYVAERQHPASVDTIVRDWQYKSLNGPAALRLAALKKFGLIEDEGTGSNRRARVSDLAVEILEHPDPAVRQRALQQAALSPTIHQEMWEKYGRSLPSDSNIRWFLTRERGFTETGASEFIPEYRSTIAYAKLFESDTVGIQDDVQGEAGADDFPTDDEAGQSDDDYTPLRNPRTLRRRQVSTTTAEVDTYFVPIAAGLNVAVEGPFPLTEAQWQQFQAVLNAMKPALVSDEVVNPVDD